jgi:Asp-tRNA(Asn)/Glu-tRNA(Gln) amidotransferase A subunit family amidase
MKKLIVIFLVFAFAACTNDYIVGDLTGKRVNILAPADSSTATTTSPLFWWSEINDATGYRIQIAFPNFTAPQQLVYDTLVSGDRFNPVLSAGRSYTWRIRPENGATEGDWVTRLIRIDSTISLSQQTVVITNPAVNASLQSGTVTFTWNALAQADLYRIELRNTVTQAILDNITVTATAWTKTGLADGSYQLKVRAENSVTSEVTPYSSRNFTIDQNGPAAPTLTAPANSTTIFLPTAVQLNWTSAADAVRDSLFISTDSTFATQTVFGFSSPAPLPYTWTGAQNTGSGYYYWRVRSYDAAGNFGTYSTRFRFRVN